MAEVLRKIRVWLSLFGHRRTPWYAKLLLVGALLYLLWPLDLLVDTVPFLGLVDDLTIAALLVSLALRLVPADVRREVQDKAATGP